MIFVDCITFSHGGLSLPTFVCVCVLIRSANSEQLRTVGHCYKTMNDLAILQDKSCCEFTLLFCVLKM